MISEGSCDTEDWSNDAENSALHQIKLYVKIEQYSNLFDWWYIKTRKEKKEAVFSSLISHQIIY